MREDTTHAKRPNAGLPDAVATAGRGGGSPRRRTPGADPTARSPQRQPRDQYGRPGQQAAASARRGPQRRDGAGRPPLPHGRAASTGGSRLRGAVAAVAVFLVTLPVAIVDSFIGVGLGLLTTVALVAATTAAVLLVRRSDVLTLVVAPPLVFLGLAVVHIALTDLATLSVGSLATLLVRGFPAMAIATGVALVLALFRRIGRRDGSPR